jgi:methylmalonyl-CoA mutase
MPGGRWQILQRIDHPDPAAANAEARHDRDNGATGWSLVLAGAIGAHGYGLAAGEGVIARALDGLPLDAAGVALELEGPQAEEAASSIAALLSRRGVPAATANIRFGFDPLGAAANSGALTPWGETAPRLGRRIAELASAGFKGPFCVADGRAIHNAGGSETQELGFVLAVAVAYLRALEGCIRLADARKMIYFRLAADADQLLSIAKFRALRRLWGRVEDACGLAPAPAFVCAETAWRMMTKHGPYVNMLRSTIAVFAAAVGGADAITVLPFTLARGLPDRFARRTARNTQLVLQAESNLAKVADASAGSGVIEDLTDQLCASAWGLLQEIERSGGAAAALEQGLIQKKVATVLGERQAALARRTDMLTGTSDYAELNEPVVAMLDVAPVPPAPVTVTLDPLPCIRLAEPFEHLRDASDRMLVESGARPKIFLANLGAPADFSPRANFAGNFFAAGGIAAVTNDGFAQPAPSGAQIKTDLAALVAAFKGAGATLACLCGCDETYAREAVAAAEALTAAGALRLYYAGRPTREAELAAAGIQTFIYAGCDAVAVLQAAQQQIAARRH